MSKETYRAEELSDGTIVDLLRSALQQPQQGGKALAAVRRLEGLRSSELLQAVRDGLGAHNLDLGALPRLIGVSELTTKRWSESSKPLSDGVKRKLAGLCLLLTVSGDDPRHSETTRLVRAAIAASGKGAALDVADAGNEATAILISVFGPAGLMAAALHRALAPMNGDEVFEEGNEASEPGGSIGRLEGDLA